VDDPGLLCGEQPFHQRHPPLSLLHLPPGPEAGLADLPRTVAARRTDRRLGDPANSTVGPCGQSRRKGFQTLCLAREGRQKSERAENPVLASPPDKQSRRQQRIQGPQTVATQGLTLSTSRIRRAPGGVTTANGSNRRRTWAGMIVRKSLRARDELRWGVSRRGAPLRPA
jgi:hypothetical protein